MKNIIKLLCFASLTGSIYAANPGMLITTNGQNVSLTVSATESATNTVVHGVKVQSGISGGSITSSVSSTSTGSGRAYGIWLDSSTGSSLKNISGSVQIESNLAANCYGVLYGLTSTVDSIALYNNSTKDSSSVGIVDWTKLNLTISNMNIGSYKSFGMYLPMGDTKIGLTSGIGGRIYASTAGNGVSSGIWLNGGYIGNLLSTSKIIAVSQGGTSYGLYVATSGNATGDISGSISADVKSANVAYGIYSGGTSAIGNITNTATISASSATGKAFALYKASCSSAIGNVSGTISVSSGKAANVYGALYGDTTLQASVGLYNYFYYNSEGYNVDWSSVKLSATNKNSAATSHAYGLSASSGNIASSGIGGSITSQATGAGNAYGIASSGTAIIGNINNFAIVSAKSNTGNAYGIYKGAATASIGTVSGSVAVDSAKSADVYGVLYGMSDTNASMAIFNKETNNSENINLDWNNVKISATNSNLGTNNTYGLRLVGTSLDDTDISGNITATSKCSGSAYAIHLSNNANIDELSGNFSAHSTNGNAYGIYNSNTDNRTFELEGATISGSSDNAKGYAIKSSYFTMTGSALFNGEVSVSEHFNMEFGSFTYNSPAIEAKVITLGSSNANADMNLIADNTNIVSDYLVIYASTLEDYSKILLDADKSLDVGIKNLIVYLSDDFKMKKDAILTLMEGTLISLSDFESVEVMQFNQNVNHNYYDFEQLNNGYGLKFRSSSKVVEWVKKMRAKKEKSLQCPLCYSIHTRY